MSNNKQQTAVEWCIDELYKLNVKFLNSRYGNQMTILEYSDCKDQIKKKAKEMEKEQIKDAYYNGTTDEIRTKKELLFEAEHFYNETYGGNK
jgi:hypothetical protein